MATAREQALAFLKSKWYSDSQIKDATANVQKQLNSWKTWQQIISENKSNPSALFWWENPMYWSSSSSSSSSSSGWSSSRSSSSSSSNTNTTDLYWDVSWGNKWVWPMDLTKGTSLNKNDAVFWDNAKARQSTDSWFLTRRNDSIAYDLYNSGKYTSDNVAEYLKQYSDFNAASQQDRDNTIRAISDRLSAIVKQEEDKKNLWDISDSLKDINADGKIDKAGFYKDRDGNYMKIYWYEGLSDEQKDMLDRLDDSKKKEVSNMWAQALQEYLKQYDATTRTKEQAEARQKNAQDIYDINRESAIIQAEQTLRNAEENYNNLKQNWQYLGNMWMPWVSATKIQAIWDALTEAKTTLWEVKRLTQLSLDAQQKQWDWQVLQYNQQIDNLMYDLRWKIGQEAIDALSKYSSAELEWKLDTIDGITAFRRELLDELDNNLSGITSASLNQMQYINQQYQDVANRMYEYAENANKVNPEMSQVKGFYVDGNGNPILNNMGQPIEIPPTAPMEPVFDKETGKLITFATDENWNIVANVQQLWNNTNSDAAQTQYWIVSLLEAWYDIWDILKAYPNANIKDVQALAEVVKQKFWADGRSLTWDWSNYNAVNQWTLDEAYKNFTNKYAYINGNGKFVLRSKNQTWWQCWAFVNNYLQSMWIGRLFTDPITDKVKNINSYEAKKWSVVIMDSPTKPQYWHVGIVTNVADDWTLTILQSNKDGSEKVYFSTKNINDKDIYWFFDPTKSIQQYNSERAWENQWDTSWKTNEYWYNPTRVWYYDKYLQWKFTSEDWKRVWNEKQFENEVLWYQNFKDAQASDFSINILAALYNLKDIWMFDYNMAALWMPRTDGFKYRKYLDNLISNQTLQNLINTKAQWASFWALSDTELDILKNAATVLDWKLDREDFNSKVNSMIKDMEQWFIDHWRKDLVDTLKAQYDNWNKYEWGEIKFFTNDWNNWTNQEQTIVEETTKEETLPSWRWNR